MIDVIVINLRRSTERRATISSRLKALGIPFKIFEAIDGYCLSQKECDQIAPPSAWHRSHCRRNALPGEIGCAVSHINLIRANANLEFFCVLEDDAVPTPDLLHFLDENTLRSLPQFDSLRLCTSQVLSRKDLAWKLASVGDYSICAAIELGGTTSAQIHSNRGAAKIISNITTIKAPIDDILYIHPQIPGFRVLEVRPGLIRQADEMEGTILNRPKPRKSKLFVQPAEVVAHWRRRIRLIQRFIVTWVFGGSILRYPMWRSDERNKKRGA
jgi:GR25 family glycosyltransferase involved in LPS biosynthesis